jgi:hypothetical protein
LKTKVSPMFLTYFMVRWEGVKLEPSEQKCTICGKPLLRTEFFTDEKEVNYEGYVCHTDKQVTWLRAS